MPVGDASGERALLEVALRLDYMIGQITPEEFRWQDANFEHDAVPGRDLLFLTANDDWIRGDLREYHGRARGHCRFGNQRKYRFQSLYPGSIPRRR